MVTVPNNLTNMFQSLDMTIDQKAKTFILHKCNTWYGDQVSNQLKCGVAPGNVKVWLKIFDLKFLHAGWIAEMHDYPKQEKGLILNGFDNADVAESVKSAKEIFASM